MWSQSQKVARESDYRKRKIREELEIKKTKYNKKIKVLNTDEKCRTSVDSSFFTCIYLYNTETFIL